MTTHTLPLQQTSNTRYLSSVRFDWIYTLLCLWTIGGAGVDVWAHANGYTDDSFFTKWHALLYSGFGSLAAFTFFNIWQNQQRGFSGWETLPKGYKNGMVGIGLFLIGGLGDMFWHVIFGVEADIEALVSPTHLFLIFGGALAVSGALSAAWHRPSRHLDNPIPTLLGVTLVLSTGTLLMIFIHPMSRISVNSPGDIGHALGISGVFLFSILLSVTMLMVKKRWLLPFGSFTLILALNSLQAASISGEYRLIYAGVISGLLIDSLNQWQQKNNSLTTIRLFAFLAPLTYFAVYFGALALFGYRFLWAIHLWSGAIFVSGLFGLMVSYLIWQPEMPAQIN